VRAIVLACFVTALGAMMFFGWMVWQTQVKWEVAAGTTCFLIATVFAFAFAWLLLEEK
jgi:hypothetical protein